MADSAKEVLQKEIEFLDGEIKMYEREINGLHAKIRSNQDLISICCQAKDALSRALKAHG